MMSTMLQIYPQAIKRRLEWAEKYPGDAIKHTRVANDMQKGLSRVPANINQRKEILRFLSSITDQDYQIITEQTLQEKQKL